MRTRTLFFAPILLAALATPFAAQAKSDKQFVEEAISGDVSEIELGKLAQQKASSADVKSFGQMLETDHQTALTDMQAVAKDLGVKAEAKPKAEAERERGKLEKLSGAAFDKEFLTYMVEDHRKDVREFQEQSKSGKGPAAETARKQLPVLQKHLDTAERLAKSATQG